MDKIELAPGITLETTRKHHVEITLEVIQINRNSVVVRQGNQEVLLYRGDLLDVRVEVPNG